MTTASHTSAEAERLSRIVADAWSATSPVAGEVDQATRQAAFKLVLETMLQNGAEQLDAPDEWADEPPRLTAREALDDALATETQRTDAIAGYLGIVSDRVADLYDIGDATPKLCVKSASLSEQPTDATREIALLVTAARAALGLETGTRNIREAAVAQGKLDEVVFDRTLPLMKEISVRGASASPNRRVRLRGTGVEAARELAQRLVCR